MRVSSSHGSEFWITFRVFARYRRHLALARSANTLLGDVAQKPLPRTLFSDPNRPKRNHREILS